MKTFPLFIKTSGRLAVVYGGGEKAAQKVRLMKKTDVRIRVVAPSLNQELAALSELGEIEHAADLTDPVHAEGAALAFATLTCPGANAALVAALRAQGALVNAVDAPELCDAYVPSIVDRDPVVVAIGTEGTAPVLAGQIRTRIEGMLEAGLGELAALAGSLRQSVARKVEPHKRRAFWRWVFRAQPRAFFAHGDLAAGRDAIARAIDAGGAPEDDAGGFVSLVGAGPGSRDLITMRGIERLQNADVVFYDRLVDARVLELARRDAERICVGKEPGAHAWPQDRINGVIAAEARKGRRVVRLKCGDPGIFGRVAEEIDALDRASVPWEIVPGVTSASAAAAALGKPLTVRGRTDTLVLTTGHTRRGQPAPNLGAHLLPGTTMAIYMGVGQATHIQRDMLRQGLDAALPVEIVEAVEMRDQRSIATTLGGFVAAVERHDVRNPAMILITRAASSVALDAVDPNAAAKRTAVCALEG